MAVTEVCLRRNLRFSDVTRRKCQSPRHTGHGISSAANPAKCGPGDARSLGLGRLTYMLNEQVIDLPGMPIFGGRLPRLGILSFGNDEVCLRHLVSPYRDRLFPCSGGSEEWALNFTLS